MRRCVHVWNMVRWVVRGGQGRSVSWNGVRHGESDAHAVMRVVVRDMMRGRDGLAVRARREAARGFGHGQEACAE